MSDINKGIPSWQRSQSSQAAASDATPDAKTAVTTSSANTSKTSSSASGPAGLSSQDQLSEQAIKFLQDPSVRDASPEEKTAFLESKGLPKADINKAMSLITVETKESTPPSITPRQHTPPSTSSVVAQIPSTTPSPPSLPARDIPPIITYPEFLMHSQKPPPLITIERLRNAAYIAGGIAATIYGASKYILTPMSEALTEARHEFAQHTIAHLDEFNNKLSEVVSRDPGSNGAGTLAHRDGDSMSETSADSDPTELFHRDYGTQTSPELDAATHENALVSTATSSTAADEAAEDVVATHTARLARITALCAEFNADSTSEGETSQEITSVVKVLGDYLDEMAYSQAYANDALTMYGASSAGAKKPEDEISRMRAEIRGIKGVLLSARNFPAIAGGGGGGGSRRAMFPPVQAPAAAA